MKLKLNIIYYIGSLAILGGLVWIVLQAGQGLELTALYSPRSVSTAEAAGAPPKLQGFSVSLFVLQLLVIVAIAGLCGFLARKVGQPSVVGEMLAGIFLGPSLLGTVFPQVSAFLFDPVSLGPLKLVSQLGLVFFMFGIGMEFNFDLLRKKVGAAIVISHASIVLPFSLGIILSYFLYQAYAPAHIPFHVFALFLGIAVSITAFPVLARIIQEKGLSNTRLGTMAIVVAAVDDITAWYLLAVVLSIMKNDSLPSFFYMLLSVLLYLTVMLYGVKPFLRKFIQYQKSKGRPYATTLTALLLVLLSSAYCTEYIGLHVLFGAFVAGTIMPADPDFRKELINRLEVVTLVLLPLFFVFTGLQMHIFLLTEGSLWSTCLLIIGVSILGKFVGSALAARISGESLHDSLALGALLNTRGLMELVVLNIGYELRVINTELYTMMVVMTLVTTMMTSPALQLIGAWTDKKSRAKPEDGSLAAKALNGVGERQEGIFTGSVEDNIPLKKA